MFETGSSNGAFDSPVKLAKAGGSMELLSSTITTTAVATIYCIYHRYRDHLMRHSTNRERTLRERVTYMLWCAAEQA
jgi:hypothetical protein